MNTYFTILFTPIRAAINEQVSIALLLIDETNVIFRYSTDKISFLKKLIPAEAANLIRQYVNGIENEIKEFHQEQQNEVALFKKTISDYSHFSERYLNYLNSFNNNLITFTKPKKIDVKADENNFKLLFEKFVSDEYSANIEPDSISKIEKAQNLLYPKIETKVNVDIEIEKILIPGIQFPIVFPDIINILGKNGKYFSAQFIDFDKKVNYLKADLSYYSNFIREIDDGGDNFIIGNEPDITSQKNHKYWTEIKEYPKISLISVEDVEKIEEHIVENDIKPVYEM